MCVIVLAAGLAWPGSAPASPEVRWTLDMVLGHDDQVLADPDIGIVAPVSEAYFTGGSRLRLRWSDPAQRRRFDLGGEASGTVYGPEVDGDDVDYRITSAFRYRFSSRFAADVSAAGWRFRRGKSSIFDFDLVRGGARLAWAPHGAWLVAAGYRHNEVGFKERMLREEPHRTENQHQNDLFVGVVRNLGSRIFLGAEFTHRVTISNEPHSEYAGPLAVLRGGAVLPGDVSLTVQTVFAHRRYDAALALEFDAEGFLDTLGIRSDDTWQFGVILERELNPQVSVFLDGSLVRQNSNDGFVEFDQARLTVGLQMDLLAPPRRSSVPGAVGRPSFFTPVVTERGVRFRHPGTGARTVSLVGGFNGWDPTRNPLRGPGDDGVWEAVIPLETGIWRYAFVVDGVWMEPVDAPRYEDDGFGGRNGVVEVPPGPAPPGVTGSFSPRPTGSEEPCP